jgi:hypothetical protein
MQTEEADLCLEFGVSSMRRRMETKFLRSVYFGGVTMDLLAGHAEIEAEINVVLKWISFP